MDKMKMESANITDMNIDKIAALFPNCITETADENGKLKKAVNFEMLRAMLSEDIAEGDEAYEFTWVGKKKAIAEANRPIRKTLRPVIKDETIPTGKNTSGNPYCSSGSVNWDTTENLYIEGDNFEVLKLLQESYLHSIDVIYIDPPYNTGSNLIYKNNFFQSEEKFEKDMGAIDDEGNRLIVNTTTNGRFHSDWCSMMFSRLILASNLLKDTGVLICAIDQSEVNTLGIMLSEVFGDKEITLVSIVHNPSGTQGRNFSHNNEYAYFVYDDSVQSIALETRSDEDADIRSFMNGAKGSAGTYLRTTGYQSFFPILIKDNQVIGFGDAVPKDIHPNNCNIVRSNGVIEVYPIDGDNVERKWLFSRETVDSVKDELFVKYNQKRQCYEIIRIKNRINYKTVWTDKKYNAKTYGTMLLNSLMDSPFSFPKSLYTVEECIKAGLNDSKNGLVMDFFSGSATTAHAVMKMNSEDNGDRSFIMIQLPEVISDSENYNNICEIGKERIRRAGAKIKSETGADIDYGFRVLKLDDTNMQDVYYTPAETTQTMLEGFESNIKPDRTDLDLLFGCLLDWGLPLSMPYSSEQIEGVTVHTYNDGDLIACFDKAIPESVIKTIAKRQPLRVVFRDDSFADSPSKINVSEIFKMLSPDTRVKVI